MESIAHAGYVDAGPQISDRLRELAGRRPGVPVLTLYCDLDPSEFGTQRARRSAYTSLLDDAGRRADEHRGAHDERVGLRADVERAAEFLADYQPRGGRGLAIFSAGGGELFVALTLPRRVPMRVVVDEVPHVAPLVAAVDEREWLIVLVDSRHGRLLRGNPEHLEEFARIDHELPDEHEHSGPAHHQRSVEHDVDAHLARVAQTVDQHLRRGGYQRLLIGGPPEIAPRLERQSLSNPARSRLAGRFEVDVPATSVDEVRRAARASFEQEERERERDRLDRLAERLGRGERAAAGGERVLSMLEQGRVEALIYDPAGGPDGGGPEDAVLERAIAGALAQSAELLPLRHHPGELVRLGHVAALLRF